MTTAWLTSGIGNVFDCIKRHKKWFWYINNCKENTTRKKNNKCLFYIPLVNRNNFQRSVWCTHFRLAGNVDSWKLRLYARNVLLLLWFLVSTRMKRRQIMDSISIHVSVKHCSFWNICNICYILRHMLSVENEPEITRLTAPATASTRHWQLECFLFRE